MVREAAHRWPAPPGQALGAERPPADSPGTAAAREVPVRRLLPLDDCLFRTAADMAGDPLAKSEARRPCSGLRAVSDPDRRVGQGHFLNGDHIGGGPQVAEDATIADLAIAFRRVR